MLLLINKQTTTSFTRDGQQWSLQFNAKQKTFSIKFVKQYDSIKKEDWIWKFCQNVNEQEICSEDWIQLYHDASIQLHTLI